MTTHLDLFSGIGGFALAAEAVWPEIEHTFCEIDPFCQAIIKKHWPTSKIYGDIRTLTNPSRQQAQSTEQSGLHTESGLSHTGVDLLTGGFPCQPFSGAGKRKGTADERHLWPEMRRVIQEFSPTYVVAENVRGLLSIDGGMVFEQVCLDLEAIGYEVQPFVIPACAVNAPHRRDRVWIVARNTKYDGFDGSKDGESRRAGGDRDTQRTDKVRQLTGSALSRNDVADTKHQPTWDTECGGANQGASVRVARSNRNVYGWSENWPKIAAKFCTLDDGLPRGLVRPRGWRNAALKGAGNAIVPQVAEQIFNAIKQAI